MDSLYLFSFLYDGVQNLDKCVCSMLEMKDRYLFFDSDFTYILLGKQCKQSILLRKIMKYSKATKEMD